MAEKIDKSLVEEHLKCPVCHETLVDARLLECGHSYCKVCICSLVDSRRGQAGPGSSLIECPYCRQNVKIIGEASSALKKNWIANNILQALTKPEDGKDGTNQDAGDGGQTCEIHPGNKKDCFCEECNYVVCSRCALIDHIHFDRGTRPKMIEEMVDSTKEQIQELLEKAGVWSAQHVVYEDAIADIKKVGSQAVDLVKRDILQEYDARLELLNKSRDRLLDLVTEKKDSFCGRMDELLQTEREFTDGVKQCCTLAKSKMDSGKGMGVVEFYKDWAEELKKHMSHEVPAMDNAENDLKIVRAIFFEQFPTPSDSNYVDIGFIGEPEPQDVDGSLSEMIDCLTIENKPDDPISADGAASSETSSPSLPSSSTLSSSLPSSFPFSSAPSSSFPSTTPFSFSSSGGDGSSASSLSSRHRRRCQFHRDRPVQDPLCPKCKDLNRRSSKEKPVHHNSEMGVSESVSSVTESRSTSELVPQESQSQCNAERSETSTGSKMQVVRKKPKKMILCESKQVQEKEKRQADEDGPQKKKKKF